MKHATPEEIAVRRERDNWKAGRDNWKAGYDEWRPAANYVQSLSNNGSLPVRMLGMHCGDVLVALVESMQAERDELAARLEAIERAEPVRGAARLTDEQIVELRQTTRPLPGQWGDTKAFARAIEAAVLRANGMMVGDAPLVRIDAAMAAKGE